MNPLIERLGCLKKEQGALLAKLFDYYDSFVFEQSSLLKYDENECNFIFKLSSGPLKDHLIEIEDDPYIPIYEKQLSELKELYIFIYTPEIASRVFKTNQAL